MSNAQMNAAYLNAICTWAGVDNTQVSDKKSTRVVFPCIQDTRAILAGSGVPDAITNRELSEKADALLSSGELWYNPGSDGKYSDFLSRYLDYVVFKDGDKAAQNLVDEKQALVAKNSDAFRKIKKAAALEFKNPDEPDKGDWAKWSQLNYPELAAAKDSMDQAMAELAQARVATGVPQARQLNKYKEQFKIIDAVETTKATPGLTMPCAAGQIFDIKNWVDKLRTNGFTTRPDEPKDVWFQPLFSMSSNYASSLDGYYKDFDQLGYKHTLDLISSTGTEESAKKAGREVTTVEGSVGFAWLRFRTSHEETKEWSDSSATRKESNSRVSISCKDKFVVDVTPGNRWDVPGFRTLFPYTRQGTPEAIKNLVRPTQLLCAVGLKYTIQIDDSLKSSFDTEFNKAKSTNGQLSVFGVNMDANYAPERSSENTHKASWNSQTGVLSVEPTNVAGCCTLLAVIGDLGVV